MSAAESYSWQSTCGSAAPAALQDLYRNRFQRACESSFRLHKHRDPLIPSHITNLVPILARYDPRYFAEEPSRRSHGILTEQLRKEKDRSPKESAQTFETIRLRRRCHGPRMKPFIEPVLACVKEGLQMRGKKKRNTRRANLPLRGQPRHGSRSAPHKIHARSA